MAALPWHEGELALQERAGSRARMAEIGPRVVRDHMPDQHREFFALLPFLLAGSVDAEGQPWASVLAGPPGFVHSPDPRVLRIDALPLPHDPLGATLALDRSIGLLGIQPHTRRRNRMNGTVIERHATGFTVQVGQSFGNCPKYIQEREALYAPPLQDAVSVERMATLDAAARRMIAGADTFFIATSHAQAGVDVSHRGGPPGFVQVGAAGQLTVPDFVGNSFFNTLGNLQLEPRCGLLFIGFGSGELLYVAARGELEWQGAERRLHLAPTQAARTRGAFPVRWR